MKKTIAKTLPKRQSGVLVHPTSFPGPYGIGDLGPAAYRFLDFLKKSGQTLWQVLPLGPTGAEGSPYQSYSSFAGQPLLISPEKCLEYGLLSQEDLDVFYPVAGERVDYSNIWACKEPFFKKAFDAFLKLQGEKSPIIKEFQTFLTKQSDWLSDYSLFMALKKHHDGKSWHEWPKSLRRPTAKTKERWSKKLETEILYEEFLQFLFYKQWFELKEYANENGISIIGDIPIFVSDDSADVWASPELFYVTRDGFPTVVSGVPPDYFSETGQLWGNPLYKWSAHKSTDYQWWIKRIQAQLSLCDYLRIDHFRAFQDYWSIPADSDTALDGQWKPGPRGDFFAAVKKALGDDLPIIAEDLGIITDEVRALRDEVGLPGMKILQFAFDGDPHNDYLPHSFQTTNCVCYSGTHDNNTTVGWYKEADEKTKDTVRCYMNTDGCQIHWDFIRTCFGSIADKAIVPIQDLFGQDETYRMNVPGVASGNWGYRFQEELLTEELSSRLLAVTKLYGRN
jgi:4-alpha-glucanotransferase